MNTEFEITFMKIDTQSIIQKIADLWGELVKPRTMMKRVTFKHPISPEHCFARIRDEWDKITCTYKDIAPWELTINSVKEIECVVSNFESLRQIFIQMWVQQKAYQETYRETWKIWDEVYFMIDEWPGLYPFIEIEWENEQIVREYTEKLGFDYNEWVFGAVDEIYLRELGLPREYINTLSIITFDNPPKEQ